MESSPLTQQTRPEAFKPKIVQLYENLFFVCPSTGRFSTLRIHIHYLSVLLLNSM